MSRQRPTIKKSVNPVFRIYTEGAETEPQYIRKYIEEYLNRNNCFNKVIFAYKPKNHSPFCLLKEAKELKDDQTWIVFDRDGHGKIPETFRAAKKANINIAFSSISFETWILMHFEYTSKSYAKCEDLTSDNGHFKKHIVDYDKALPNLFVIATKDNGLPRAIANAEKLCTEIPRGYPAGTPIYDMNPYTNFHLLLDAIDRFLKIDPNAKRQKR